jgi:CRISPR system Cascade subunit CasA
MTAPFNLLRDAWIPVLRAGRPARIRPAEIADPAISANAIAWPRADFYVAQLEFLIGLLATACPPLDHETWVKGWTTPPAFAELEAAFAPFEPAFNLDGQGPRFMQDLEELVAESEPLERLLIEAPGDNAVKKNTDLLVKRDRVARMSRATAALALYTLQSWAPSGGAGNRVGLRGGGPLLTLVLPDPPMTDRVASLWHTLWANVPCLQSATAADMPKVFPWCAPTRTSETNRVTTPVDVHPLQVFWGMPRRIRLDFVDAAATPCDLTGDADAVSVTGWRQRPRGTMYAGWSERHPLVPYYRMKKSDTEALPVHGRAGGIQYRDWVGLVLRDEASLRLPASCVRDWFAARAEDAESPRARLLAAGYAMDNMKAEAFVESEIPLLAPADATMRAQVETIARRFIQAAELAASLARSAVRNALFAEGATVKPDANILEAAREKVWQQTEIAFFVALHAAAQDTSPQPFPDPRSDAWRVQLRRAAIAVFDEAAPITVDQADNARRIATARRFLLSAFEGYGRDGRALFEALQMTPPEKKSEAKKEEKVA